MAATVPLSADQKAEIARVYRETGSVTETARRCGVGLKSAERYGRNVARAAGAETQSARPETGPAFVPVARLPDPAPEAGGPGIPEPVADSYDPFPIDTPGKWLILSDVHLPHHDKRTVESAVEEARRSGAVGVLLNGDIMDCGELSTHDRDPSEPRLEDEVDIATRFFEWLRSRLPRARLIWREGNHEARLPRYLARNAKALCGGNRVTLPSLVGSDKFGVEWVDGGRIAMLGKLAVVHGHEFKGGGGVNPARWLFLQAVSTAMCGHFHRTSEHHETGLDRRTHGVWSVGCACFLYPRWYRNNKWNHGYAIATVEADGHFSVTNRRILRDGRVV